MEMGTAKDRWIIAQNILAKYGGVDKIDLESEMAKVQALINITGMRPQPIAPQNVAPSPTPPSTLPPEVNVPTGVQTPDNGQMGAPPMTA